jgi:hypothetical protein
MANAHAAIDESARAERELNAAVNHAIGETEDEIFRDAMGEEPLDNNGDTSLEEMGDAPEGDALEDDTLEHIDDAEQDEQQVAREESEGDEQADARPQALDDAAQARPAEETPSDPPDEQTQWREQLAALHSHFEARFNDLLARLANGQPQQQQPQQQEQAPARPDPATQPDAYDKWLRENATRDALAAVRQEQHANHRNGVERNFGRAMRTERGLEFMPAYNALLALDNTIPRNRELMQAIYFAPDPSAALFRWWDATVGPQYRAATAHYALSRLSPELREQVLAPLGAQARSPARSQQPRHEFRPAQPLPSLNSATGSNVHRTSDPDLLDNSDASVFAFATR